MENRIKAWLLAPHEWLGQKTLPVARYQIERVWPLREFSSDMFTQNFGGRLLLLNQAEWQALGLAVAALPFIGSLEDTLDGRLQRAIKAHFSDEQIKQLNNLDIPDVQFLLKRSEWKHVEKITHAGISNLIGMGIFSILQERLLSLRFPVSPPAVSVCHFTTVEVLCNILFPNLPWLSATSPSTTQQVPVE